MWIAKSEKFMKRCLYGPFLMELKLQIYAPSFLAHL
jgi:hypothetical protein